MGAREGAIYGFRYWGQMLGSDMGHLASEADWG